MTALADGPLRLVPALRLYADGLRAASAGHATALQICDEDGSSRPVPLHHWCTGELPGDGGLLSRCSGTTLDVGCGPGRLTAALAGRGVPALGIDIAPAAVTLSRRRGAAVLRASVFGPLPAEGSWDTVLLADGNIGIGGDPVTLLRRCRELIAPRGSIAAELDPDGRAGVRRVHLRSGAGRSEWFDWAHVGTHTVAGIARESGLRCAETWTEEGRWFATMTRR